MLAEPTLVSERLYVIGPGDILPIVSDESNFHQVLLPGAEKGYVLKSGGLLVEVGLGEVKEPLGYVRVVPGRLRPSIRVQQPNGQWESVHQLENEDRLPVIAEREHGFTVQPPNGLRGMVHKADVIRTISPISLPPKDSGVGLVSALGIGALIGIAAAVGDAFAGDSDEARIRRAVDRALYNRGL